MRSGAEQSVPSLGQANRRLARLAIFCDGHLRSYGVDCMEGCSATSLCGERERDSFSAEELAAILNAGSEVTIVDVRSSPPREMDLIYGAIRIPTEDLPARPYRNSTRPRDRLSLHLTQRSFHRPCGADVKELRHHASPPSQRWRRCLAENHLH